MNDDVEFEPNANEPKKEGGNTRLLFLVLLLLVAVFGYLYYFTGLIKPREEAKAPEAVPPAQVKQPIPPRPEQKPAETSTAAKTGIEAEKKAEPAAAAKPEEKKGEPAKPVASNGKPETAKSAKAEGTQPKKEGTKPVEVAKVVPSGEQKKNGAVSTENEKGKGVAAEPSKKEAKKEAPSPEKKKAVATEKAGKAKIASTAAAKKHAAAKKPESKGTGEYTLRIGEYVVADAMERDKEKAQDSGFTPLVKQGPKKKEPMIRLYLGEFGDQESAKRELAKLHDATVEGFVLNEGGKYRVYAGSYFLHERAVKEQQRLTALGIKPTLKKASVSVPTLLLTAGKFSNREDAVKAAAKLRQKGLKPAVVESPQQ
ncbi:SPOR domain-containing protein [Geobacter pickeringii]|uniref:SPOR domain-containing protein n=1 Tax=Geobacter pickeringii TaxID=345632 RepID=A0A0B5BA45_9BACT|nr:SPOR domain-containing protein [Geobacter pickeringii]AJE03457.1 hypothetical protein GPICK_08920 [Geobacter pickeringii]